MTPITIAMNVSKWPRFMVGSNLTLFVGSLIGAVPFIASLKLHAFHVRSWNPENDV